MRRHALAEVVVAEGEREAGVAGRAERLAGDDRHLGLVEHDVGQLERGRSACGRGSSRPSTPVERSGRRRTRPAARGR